MHTERVANLLGATALAVTDLALTDATEAGGVSTSGAAAIVVLSASSAGLSVTELGKRVGLSQSAAARMVDSLEAKRMVARRTGPGRSVSVDLTPAGRRTGRALLAARAAPLNGAVAVLDEDEQETLAALLAKLLTGLYGEIGSAELLCRMCDRASCVRDATCPVGQAERDRGH